MLFLLSFLLALATLPAPAQETLPSADSPPDPAPAPDIYAPAEYGIDRYQKIRGKSPFEFELAKPPVEEAVDPFADYVLAGFAGSGSRVTVYLMNTKTQERITVLGAGTGRKNESGFSAIAVKRGRTLLTTTALIEKDGLQHEVSFDPKALSGMTGGAGGGGGTAAAGRPAMPGQAQPNGQPVIRPNTIPGQAAKPYQAPQAFIPGQNNRMGMNPALSQAQQNPSLQLGAQNGNAARTSDAQQQLNTMLLNTPSANGVQPTVIPNPNGIPGAATPPQPRRRVVLPTP